MSKAKRQMELEKILLQDNKGWRQAELARKLNVHRSTVGRDIREMEKRLPLQEKRGKIYLDQKSYLSSLQLSLHEILALNHAAKVMARHSPLGAYHVSSALQKMSKAIRLHSPEISETLKESSKELKSYCGNEEKKQIRNLEKLNQAWMEKSRLQLKHTPLMSEELIRETYLLASLETESQGEILLMAQREDNQDTEIIPLQSVQSVRVLQEASRPY